MQRLHVHAGLGVCDYLADGRRPGGFKPTWSAETAQGKALARLPLSQNARRINPRAPPRQVPVRRHRDARRVRAALLRALSESDGSGVRILLENTAGAGGTMGVDFDELGAMIAAAGGHPRLGLCLDTAHLFEAGFDLRTAAGLGEALGRLDAACGLDRLGMLHLNDSKTPMGSNRDRHENIGEGEIGLEGFRAIVTSPVLADLPGILEVPGFDGDGPDLLNVQRLRDLATGAT